MQTKNQSNQSVVLIVEDTVDNSEIIQTFLDDIHVPYETACSGMEAVALCQASDPNHYALILMDINLPGINGFEATAMIRDLGLDIPTVAVTATDKNDTSLKGAAEFFDFLLYKPFNYLEFYTAISPYVKNAMAFTSGIEDTFGQSEAFARIDTGVCDARKAISNMGNNPRLFMKHFNNFKSNNADLAASLQELADQQDFIQLAFRCHSAKGLSGMLGLNNITDHIVQLEKLAKCEPPLPSDHMQRINETLNEIREDIRAICQIQF